VEAGGDDTDPMIWDANGYFTVGFGPTYSWGYNTENQTHANNRQLHLPRGKVWGGSSSINGMVLVQGNPEDFDRISEETEDNSWRWNSLKSYRQIVKRELGDAILGIEQEGASAYIAAADSIGIDFNPDQNSGNQAGIGPTEQTGYLQTPTRGIRNTPFDVFVRPQLERSQLELLANHRVDKILIDPVTKTVTGIQCTNLRRESTITFTVTREVILSAGTYNTPKLLMLSGIGPQDILDSFGIPVISNLPGVGQNLRDHYSVATYWGTNLAPNAPFAFQTPVLSVFGPETEGPTTFQFELSGTYGSVVPLRSNSIGTVTLRSASSEDAPVIDPNILSDPNDLSIIIQGIRTFILPFFSYLRTSTNVTSAGYSLDTSLEYTDMDLENFVRSNINTSHHPVGTAKMGPDSDNLAVVNSKFKVRGVNGIRVVDASIFPKPPSGNINAPVIVSALKAVDEIARS
jgi:choline dehydrogenase